jgi:hypothetical protein
MCGNMLPAAGHRGACAGPCLQECDAAAGEARQAHCQGLQHGLKQGLMTAMCHAAKGGGHCSRVSAWQQPPWPARWQVQSCSRQGMQPATGLVFVRPRREPEAANPGADQSHAESEAAGMPAVVLGGHCPGQCAYNGTCRGLAATCPPCVHGGPAPPPMSPQWPHLGLKDCTQRPRPVRT